ncbi:hypothetical protein BATDEDRAFT_23379 [Batrachochytrium dendrobatidis JAM81]|uniref:Uncharacterized protein n=1 Tax=Batrachochytrium dendrobatidis (strain JAM81 / FGSC 10211) TaxID=684364 RepID=F4NYU9_BATDJ|nr:uncharacterized protein BATDEDRAFT_23379 [Batrachochytrium dendrobatidis JAM81]EGF82092.1 hypothetical protein BATDEDRAFT_23379 [Batrachochytrium dendrobatidis JAM81]KAJ8324785.1 hypothetical protein O5D80_007013 [Batrachochytrium dendrobatidis]KAK5671021.1 hypothetical protein QVD99_002786 [Batrachochytrium dendrobatidis]|eukprot:XP_006677269.1 hypothetical protein BATDEDRAFT_23379 [Batrachochytrium dendrobatidis JAM81]
MKSPHSSLRLVIPTAQQIISVPVQLSETRRSQCSSFIELHHQLEHELDNQTPDLKDFYDWQQQLKEHQQQQLKEHQQQNNQYYFLRRFSRASTVDMNQSLSMVALSATTQSSPIWYASCLYSNGAVSTSMSTILSESSCHSARTPYDIPIDLSIPSSTTTYKRSHSVSISRSMQMIDGLLADLDMSVNTIDEHHECLKNSDSTMIPTTSLRIQPFDMLYRRSSNV